MCWAVAESSSPPLCQPTWTPPRRFFSRDAVFWGTVSPDLGTSPESVRKYFQADYAGRAKTPYSGARIADKRPDARGRWGKGRARANPSGGIRGKGSVRES